MPPDYIGSPGMPPVDTRTKRAGEGLPLPMVAPEANPFFQTIHPFSANQLLTKSDRVRRAEPEGEYSPTIYGVVITSSQYTQYGIKQIPTAPGQDFTPVQGYGAYFNQVTSGTESDGIFYTNNLVSRYGQLYCSYYNALDINNNWNRLAYSQSSDLIYSGRDMATDPLTGDMYGCLIKTSAGVGYVLARVEYKYSPYGQFTEFSRDAICDLPNLLTALFFTPDGQLWGIDMITDIDEDSTSSDKTYTKSASLYRIDKHTGEMTLVGDTGVKPYYVSSACCDLYGNGKVYWSVKTKENVGSLYTVDLETGAATKVMDFPRNEEVVAMFVPIQSGEKAPGEPENLTADFPEGSLEGNIRFDVPALLNDGSAGEGDVDWQVVCMGDVVDEGTAPYGGSVACPYVAEQAGMYSFAVRLSNAAGKGKRVSFESFIGDGIPETPVVNAAHVNGRIVLAWEPVTKAYGDRGYVDFDELTYEVRRYPDETVVSEGKKATSYIEEVPADADFGYYTYGVTAVSQNTRSGEGKSNMLVLGTITPPFEETFDDTSLIGYGDNATGGVYPNYDLDGSTLGHWYIHGMDKAATCSTGFGDEDSWLMTPGFRLEAGKSYTISFDAYTSFATNPDKYSRLKVMIGNGQNPDAMSEYIFDEFTVTNLKGDKAFMIHDFSVPSTGTYYLGFNCCTRNGGAQVYMDNLRIEESPEPGLPGPCSAMTVRPQATGSLTAVITVTAPTKDNRNQVLDGNVDMELFHDGEKVAAVQNVVPGSEVNFSHTVGRGGDITYTVRASNANGSGRELSAGAYLGFYAPRAVSDVRLTRIDSSRSFKIEWTAPTSDIKWNDLTPSDLTFALLGVTQEGETYIISDNIEGDKASLEFTDPNADFDGPARFVYYGVAACSNGGVSSVTPSNVVSMGNAYPTPYRESFSGAPAGIYSADNGSSLSTWYNLSDSDLDLISSQDGDNGYLACYANSYNVTGCLQTGLIDLSGLETPGVTFYVYNLYQEGHFNDNQIFVAINDGGPKSYVVKAEPDLVGNLGKANQWAKYAVSLESFKGKTVSLMLVATTQSLAWTFIDNLSVDNLPMVDLSAGPSAGTPLIEEGQSGLYVFNVVNNGYGAVSDFTVDLIRNGRTVNTHGITEIAPGEVKQFSIVDYPDVDADSEAAYFAKVVAAGDADESDNESDPIQTRIVLPPYPTVESVSGELTGKGAVITWEDPELDYVPNLRTETFESADSWATSFDGWTFIDVDRKPVNLGTADGAFGPDVRTGSNQSFFIMDVSQLDEQRQGSVYFQGHSGIRYLMKCAPGDVNETGDDWAITPELYGEPQTVTLWAHSHSASSPENIEGLYSTGSLDPADFISVGKYIDVPQGWTMYSFELPAGAKRFAVRACSQATFLLQIDDITYQPMPFELDLMGFHVWRNGVRLTSDPIEGNVYTDTAGKDGDVYRISPVFHLGEAVPGQSVTVKGTGMDGIAESAVVVRSIQRGVTVTGALGRNIDVFRADGTHCRSVEGLFSNIIPLEGGVYVIKVGASAVKVVVR